MCENMQYWCVFNVVRVPDTEWEVYMLRRCFTNRNEAMEAKEEMVIRPWPMTTTIMEG
jgi:hypothetical protein